MKEDMSAVAPYFHDIAGSKPLSREREIELSARVRQGDSHARDELIEANLRFVVDTAKRYQHRGLPLEDLISVGNLGLITAAERFDGAKGFKFISYAVWWIKQAILQAIAEQVRAIRLPLNRVALLRKISKADRLLSQRTGGDDSTPEELAAELNVPVEEIEETLLAGRSIRSLDAAFDDKEDDRSLLSVLADEDHQSPDESMSLFELREDIDKVISRLDEREQKVVRLYYGLDGEEAMTLDQIGASFGLTRERIRQIKEKALCKLRHPSRADGLKEYYTESEPEVGSDGQTKDWEEKREFVLGIARLLGRALGRPVRLDDIVAQADVVMGEGWLTEPEVFRIFREDAEKSG